MKANDVPKHRVHLMDSSILWFIYSKGNGCRIDNHEHKGDHRHFRATTTPYVFTTVDRLIEDFRRDVTAVKKEPGR